MSTIEGSGRFINNGLAFYVDFANKGSFKPNLMNYSNWNLGAGSIIGNPSLYGVNGYALSGDNNENIRVIGTDPFGNTQSIIWKGFSQDGTLPSGDGGFDSSQFSIDPTKMYRYSVWTKRDGMTPGLTSAGSFYLGVYAFGSDGSQHVLNNKNNTMTSNCYFHITPNPAVSTNTSINPPYLGGIDVWTLVVGHIWPTGTPTASFNIGSNVNGLPLNYDHRDSGVWTRSGSKIGNLYNPTTTANGGDWIWGATSSRATYRTYHFYSSDSTATQSFVYPRVDIIDGTEPTIQQLLTGVEPVKNLITNGSNINSTSLDDIIYSSSTNFSTEKNGCIIFNSAKRDNIQGTISTTFSMYSASIWFNTTTDINAGYSGGALFQIRNSGASLIDLYLGNVTGLVVNEVITLATNTERTSVTDITITGNTWNNIIINWESTSYAIYLNGVKQTTTSGSSTNVSLNTFVNYLVLGARYDFSPGIQGLGSYFDGKMSSFAMWQRSLSTAEILTIYTKGKSKLGI